MASKTLKPYVFIAAIVILGFAAFFITGLSPFTPLDRALYDMGIRFGAQEKPASSKIVIVEIDDKSLARFGPWPWPGSLISDMILFLKEKEAACVSLNLPFLYKERNRGLARIRSLREEWNLYPGSKQDRKTSQWMLHHLDKAEKELNNDARLTEAVKKSGRVNLPLYGLFGPFEKGNRGSQTSIKNLSGHVLKPANLSESVKEETSTRDLLVPFDPLSTVCAGLGHGHVTLKGDDLSPGKHPLFIRYKGALIPSLPLRTALLSLNVPPNRAEIRQGRLTFKNIRLPVSDGGFYPKFFKSSDAFPKHAFSDVLKPRKGKTPSLKGKIVLIGLTFGGSPRYRTPVNSTMSGPLLSASILHGILSSEGVSRPGMLSAIELGLMILFGALTGFLLTRFGFPGQVVTTAAILTGIFGAGIASILFFDLWIKTASIAVCSATVAFAMIITRLLIGDRPAKESMETNRLLGLSFQSQGLLDLAFDKFKKLPLDNETKDLLYNLGLEYEQKRLINKALEVYEYISRKEPFRDLSDRIPRLKESDKSSTLGSHGGVTDASPLSDAATPGGRTKVGRFEIIGELGKGSMGLVYKAMDPKINRLLAIKTIRFSDEFEEDVIQEIKDRFFREAEIAGQLSHPSIVTIYDVGEDQDLTYMAMEFLEGKDLEGFTSKENRLPFMKVLEVVTHVSEALDFAHQHNVIHRDIKPANIMLLDSGGVKVTDFGIAKAISSSRTRTGVILGTPNYMSPEQIMGQKIDHRSDIFSLGVLFYQLLTGDLPFHGENLSNLLYQITQVKHAPIRTKSPKIPRICEQIVDKAMAKNPENRFKTAGEMTRILHMLSSKLNEAKRKKASTA